MQIPIDATCVTCRWFDIIPSEDEAVSGHCRRHAPSSAGWPVTDEADYCGDWQSDYAPVLRTRKHPTWSEVKEQFGPDLAEL
jgi:hypothetical protein